VRGAARVAGRCHVELLVLAPALSRWPKTTE
jgi:hypothetical protein